MHGRTTPHAALQVHPYLTSKRVGSPAECPVARRVATFNTVEGETGLGLGEQGEWRKVWVYIPLGLRANQHQASAIAPLRLMT